MAISTAGIIPGNSNLKLVYNQSDDAIETGPQRIAITAKNPDGTAFNFTDVTDVSLFGTYPTKPGHSASYEAVGTLVTHNASTLIFTCTASDCLNFVNVNKGQQVPAFVHITDGTTGYTAATGTIQIQVV